MLAQQSVLEFSQDAQGENFNMDFLWKNIEKIPFELLELFFPLYKTFGVSPIVF